MEDRKYDRRCDTGSAFPLRTSTNQPTRSMGIPAVPVLMKSSSSKNLQDEVSEKRRRECMSQQLRGGPSLPSKSLFLGALGGSKVATASDLPTITGKKPLPRALLPKEARKNSYQSLISGPFAFSSGLGVTTGPAYGMQQRRSSISSCYPLRPGAVRFDRVSNGTGADKMSTENRLQTADDALWQLSQDKARRNSVNTLSPPPMDVTTQISLSRGRTSAGGGGGGVAVEKQNIDTGSIYPMLRMAFGKDENDDDSTVIRRNPGREGTGRKERPVSYADPHSFRKMQEDLQTPEYMEYHHPPSYDPPPEPTKTSFDTHYAFVRSESSSISNNTPGLQDNDFEKASNSIPLQTLTRNSNNTISEDHSRRVPRLSEEVKPQLQDSLQDNFEITKKPEALSPSTTGPKLQSPISTKLDEISPNETETKIKSPVTLKTETISPHTTEPKIQSPLTSKPKAISTNPAGSNREDWYSPIPASPRRVIRSPLLSSGSSAKSKDSPFENMRKPRSAFNFDIEVNPRSVKDSTKHEENESYTSSPQSDQNLMAEENNNDTPPELPSSAPPPLPLASHPLGAPVRSPSGPRHPDLEYNSTPDTTPENRSSKPTRDRTAVETVTPTLPTIASPPLPVTPPPTSVQHISLSKQRHPDLENDGSSDKTADNWSSNQSTNDSETFEIAAPALSCSFSPSLPVNSHPTDAPIIPPSGLHHTALEHSSSSSNSPATIPEICSKEPINDDSTTVETLPPALPSSAPPPLPVTSPPTNAPIIPPFVEHHEDLQHISSSETDSYLNEAVTSNEHGATAESINDGMEQTESIGRQQRQSLSSEESLLEGQETKASAAQNRETLSPTLSDADSGIDSVKLEQKRSYETSMTNEEYQTALWDEQSETPAAGILDRAVSPVSNDRNIIDATSPDATLSNVNPASVEPQPVIRNASDCVVMSSPADAVPTPIETGSERNEESASIKTKTSITLDKETDASVLPSQNGEDKSAFAEDDRKTSSGDLPLDPLPPSGDQILAVQSELSEKKCDVALIGERKLTTVHIQKGIMGLGFSVQGGKGSAYGDKPLTVKKIFKAGDASVREVLTVGDELISANGKDLTNCSSHEAWSYLKTLPDGTVDLVIGKASDA